MRLIIPNCTLGLSKREKNIKKDIACKSSRVHVQMHFIIKYSTSTVLYLNKIKPLSSHSRRGSNLRQQPAPCQPSNLSITNGAPAFVMKEAMLNFNKDNIVPHCRIPQQVCINTSAHSTFLAHRGPWAHERDCHISPHAQSLPATSEPPKQWL